MARTKMRFKVSALSSTGKKTHHLCNDVVEAWNWFAYYTATGADDIVIEDRRTQVEANG